MKTFTLFQRLLLVAIYLLGSIVFNQPILGFIYGDVPLLPVLISGLVIGLLAVQTEDWLYQHKGCWPKKPLLYWLRATFMGILWLALSHTMAAFITLTQACAIAYEEPCSLIDIVTMNYFIMMLFCAMPLGLVTGVLVGQLILTMTKSRLITNTSRG